MSKTPLQVGLSIGQGTGAELAEVFEKVIHEISRLYAMPVEVRRSLRKYHTYFSLLAENDPKVIQNETLEDVRHYEKFCEEEFTNGTHVIFRTAINAQSLYIVRQDLEAVKVECFSQGQNSLLLIRDEAQGFYTGSNRHESAQGTIYRTCKFSRELTGRIVSYSLGRARKLWGENAIDSVLMVYKFHLFDGALSLWAQEWSEKYGIKVQFVQPDTANRNLLAFGIQKRQLMIAGNEWADIMHSILLDKFQKGPQEARCTENIYLHSRVHGLVEYQTVHGSADDIAGKGVVNPMATIRAAAAILERHGGCNGAERIVDYTLEILHRRRIVTPDQGGSMSTKKVVDSFLDIIPSTASLSGELDFPCATDRLAIKQASQAGKL